jgi:hypothetical protein
VVPVAAKELLDGAIDQAQELAVTRYELISLISRESDTPWADLLAARNHDALTLREVHECAEELIGRLRSNQSCDDEYRAWRQAVGRYERRTT